MSFVYPAGAYEPAQEMLDRLEDEFGGRFRLITGGGRTRTPEDWHAEAKVVEGGPGAESGLDGFTLVVYGSLSPIHEYVEYEHPQSLLAEGWAGSYPEGYSYHDSISVRESLFNEVELEGVKIGEVDEKLLVTYSALNNRFAWETLEPLIRLTMSDDFAAQAEERRVHRNRELFLSSVQRRDAGHVQELRNEISDRLGRLTEAQHDIDRWRAECAEKQEELDLILARREEQFDEEKAINEWDALQRHVKIDRLAWENSNTLVCFTDEIEISHPDLEENVPVGKFSLRLDMSVPEIQVRNLTNRRGEFDHPHVRNGAFCTGEVGPTLSRLLRERQVSAAVNLALRSLHHVVPNDDYGRHISWWMGDEDAPNPTVTE